jgi:hypothetical protein
MNVALATVAAVALIFGVAMSAWATRYKQSADRARERVEELTDRVEDAVRIIDQLEQDKRKAEVRAGAAESRAKAAEQKSVEAERRAGEAQKGVADAMRRADEAARTAAASPGARAVWELERVRAEREWLDVVGPGIPLPVPWDGSVGAVVATELAVIREVVGTTSEVTHRGEARPTSPAVAAAVARLGVELVRALARSGEEMSVEIGDGSVTVVQLVPIGEPPPDISVLSGVAERAGLSLSVETDEDRSTVRLSFDRGQT